MKQKASKALSIFLAAALLCSLAPAFLLAGRAAGGESTVTNSSDADISGSLRYVLSRAADGEEILFGSAVREIILKSPLTVPASVKNLAIDGGAGVVIKRAANDPNEFRLMNFPGLAELTVKGLTLENGHSVYPLDAGSAALGTKEEMIAGDGFGGAILAGLANVNAADCVFRKNTASYGGGIFTLGSVDASNCDFSENSTLLHYYRDGIDIYEGLNAGGGAGIAAESVRIAGCSFTKNKSENGAGVSANYSAKDAALAEKSHSVTATNCSFTGNSGSNGCGIYTGGTIAVTGCVFTNNSARDNGGALLGVTINAVDSTFANNNAAYVGGGLIGITITAANCEFKNNSAGYFGGAVYGANESAVTAANCRFTKNEAFVGAALFAEHAAAINSAFIGNERIADIEDAMEEEVLALLPNMGLEMSAVCVVENLYAYHCSFVNNLKAEINVALGLTGSKTCYIANSIVAGKIIAPSGITMQTPGSLTDVSRLKIFGENPTLEGGIPLPLSDYLGLRAAPLGSNIAVPNISAEVPDSEGQMVTVPVLVLQKSELLNALKTDALGNTRSTSRCVAGAVEGSAEPVIEELSFLERIVSEFRKMIQRFIDQILALFGRK